MGALSIPRVAKALCGGLMFSDDEIERALAPKRRRYSRGKPLSTEEKIRIIKAHFILVHQIDFRSLTRKESADVG